MGHVQERTRGFEVSVRAERKRATQLPQFRTPPPPNEPAHGVATVAAIMA